jgi:predicted  nucleic acid-binding Zn-ribbon protein
MSLEEKYDRTKKAYDKLVVDHEALWDKYEAEKREKEILEGENKRLNTSLDGMVKDVKTRYVPKEEHETVRDELREQLQKTRAELAELKETGE